MNELKEVELFKDLKSIIDAGKQELAVSVNAILTATYWQIGYRISKEILNEKRANYGEAVLKNISLQLTQTYGKGWSTKQLLHCLRFAETFKDHTIVSALWRQLSWTHFKTIMYINEPLKRTFTKKIAAICRSSTKPKRKS